MEGSVGATLQPTPPSDPIPQGEGEYSLPRLGVRLHGGLDPKTCVVLARCAEAHGYASLWFAENPTERGVFPAVSACVVATNHIRIGVGIVNPYTRHPTLIAMEFAALDELADGRALLGIGSGIGAQIERLGFRYRPFAAMEDAVHIVRALLGGERVNYQGRVFSADNFPWDFARRGRICRSTWPLWASAAWRSAVASRMG